VVPVEATEEIRDAVIDAAFDLEYITEDDDAAKIYQAAIKAAAPGVKP
jgi:DNA-dependent RNA polymerase auxiliary subunit epsilon